MSEPFSLFKFLSGYKTYLTAAAGLLTAIAAYANGQEPLGDLITQAITALSAIFLRSGVSATINKALDTKKDA